MEYIILTAVAFIMIIFLIAVFYHIEYKSSATENVVGNIEIHAIPDDIDGPYMFLQLEVPVQDLMNMTEAKLRIVVHKD